MYHEVHQQYYENAFPLQLLSVNQRYPVFDSQEMFAQISSSDMEFHKYVSSKVNIYMKIFVHMLFSKIFTANKFEMYILNLCIIEYGHSFRTLKLRCIIYGMRNTFPTFEILKRRKLKKKRLQSKKSLLLF